MSDEFRAFVVDKLETDPCAKNTLIIEWRDHNGKKHAHALVSKEPITSYDVEAHMYVLGDWLTQEIATSTKD